MYAAVAYRGREIATLRVIGFSRPSILTSFMLESLLLSLLGATGGIFLMLPFNGMTYRDSKPGHLQRGGFQFADDSGGCQAVRWCSRLIMGCGGRACSGVACCPARF